MKLDWPESIRACSNCWDTWNPGGSQLSWGSNFVATMTSPRRFSLPNLYKINYYKKPNFWIINWTNISSNSKFPTNLCRMSFFLISFEQKNWRKQLLAHKSESFCFNIFCSNGKIHFFWRENQNLLEYWVLDKNYLYKLRLLTCFDRKWLNLPSWMFWEVQ